MEAPTTILFTSTTSPCGRGFLTKNGRGRYAIMDIQDYERLMATIKLMGALETGRKSGEEQGWISSEQLKSELGI